MPAMARGRGVPPARWVRAKARRIATRSHVGWLTGVLPERNWHFPPVATGGKCRFHRGPGETDNPLPIRDLELLDAVDPAVPQAPGLSGLGDVGHPVGDLVEDELDLHAREVGADA